MLFEIESRGNTLSFSTSDDILQQTRKRVLYFLIKVCHSWKLYQGFAENYFLGIYLQSKAYNQKEHRGSLCILLSNGSMKLAFLFLNSNFV